MNTRKQKIVDKISEKYSESKNNAVIVCNMDNLNAKELKEFKRKIWSVGSAVFVKNTLFCQSVSSHVKNYKSESNMRGSNCIIFSKKDKDIFQTMSAIKEGMKKFKIQSKVRPNQVLLEDKFYEGKSLEIFTSFPSKQALEGGICLLTKLIPIKICKILSMQIKK